MLCYITCYTMYVALIAMTVIIIVRMPFIAIPIAAISWTWESDMGLMQVSNPCLSTKVSKSVSSLML